MFVLGGGVLEIPNLTLTEKGVLQVYWGDAHVNPLALRSACDARFGIGPREFADALSKLIGKGHIPHSFAALR